MDENDDDAGDPPPDGVARALDAERLADLLRRVRAIVRRHDRGERLTDDDVARLRFTVWAAQTDVATLIAAWQRLIGEPDEDDGEGEV